MTGTAHVTEGGAAAIEPEGKRDSRRPATASIPSSRVTISKPGPAIPPVAEAPAAAAGPSSAEGFDSVYLGPVPNCVAADFRSGLSACTAAPLSADAGATSTDNAAKLTQNAVTFSSRSSWVHWLEPHPPYLDNNSSTPVDPGALRALMPYLKGVFGNPGSTHVRGVTIKKAFANARERVARCLGCLPQCVFFTSGATESLNWVLKGVAFNQRERKESLNIVTTRIEHPAVMAICEWLLADKDSLRLCEEEQNQGKEDGEQKSNNVKKPFVVTSSRQAFVQPTTVALCPVDEEGIIDLEALDALLSEEESATYGAYRQG